METNDKTGVVMVMTSATQEQILLDGGVFVGRVNAEKVMNTCKYVFCVQNNPSNDEDESLYDHKTGFLIGTITKVSPPNGNGEKLISFDTYAEVHKKGAWVNGPTRQGLAYYDTPTDAKLRLGNYEFKPVQPDRAQPDRKANVKPNVTEALYEFAKPNVAMMEAKTLIAESLGVRPDQIEITIKV